MRPLESQNTSSHWYTLNDILERVGYENAKKQTVRQELHSFMKENPNFTSKKHYNPGGNGKSAFYSFNLFEAWKEFKENLKSWLNVQEIFEFSKLPQNAKMIESLEQVTAEDIFKAKQFLLDPKMCRYFKLLNDSDFDRAIEILANPKALKAIEAIFANLEVFNEINDPKSINKALNRFIKEDYEKNLQFTQEYTEGIPKFYSPKLIKAFLEKRHIPKGWLSASQILAQESFKKNIPSIHTEAALNSALSTFIRNYPYYNEQFKKVGAFYYSSSIVKAFVDYRTKPDKSAEKDQLLEKGWLTPKSIFDDNEADSKAEKELKENLRIRLAEIDIKTPATLSIKIKEFAAENLNPFIEEGKFTTENSIKNEANQTYYSLSFIETYLQDQKPLGWLSSKEVINNKDYSKVVKSKSPLDRAIKSFLEVNPETFTLDGQIYNTHGHFKQGKGRIPNFFSPLFLKAILKIYYPKPN